VATARGDMMPKNQMTRMLSELGVAPAESPATAAAPQDVGSDQVLCSRCGRVGRKMASPPFSNAQGKLIHERFAPIAGTMDRDGYESDQRAAPALSDPQAQKIF